MPASQAGEQRLAPFMRRSVVLISYFARLDAPRMVLWCYLIWYLVMAGFYFDPSPRIWLTSAGLAVIIGIALVLSVRAAKVPVKMERWQLFRAYLTPFCVSSFAALVKDHGFILIFSPVPAESAVALGACTLFCGSALLLRRWG